MGTARAGEKWMTHGPGLRRLTQKLAKAHACTPHSSNARLPIVIPARAASNRHSFFSPLRSSSRKKSLLPSFGRARHHAGSFFAGAGSGPCSGCV